MKHVKLFFDELTNASNIIFYPPHPTYVLIFIHKSTSHKIVIPTHIKFSIIFINAPLSKYSANYNIFHK